MVLTEAKKETLANLANFAYDPINYEHLRKLNVLDLFLDALEEANEKIVEFAIGGICNACLDKQNKDYILKNDGVRLVTRCLSSVHFNEQCGVLSDIIDIHYSMDAYTAYMDFVDIFYSLLLMLKKGINNNHTSPNEDTVLSATTTLMYLMTPTSKQEITALPIVECMLRFSQSKNKKLSNLAQVFLEDYCSEEQIQEARRVQQELIKSSTLENNQSTEGHKQANEVLTFS